MSDPQAVRHTLRETTLQEAEAMVRYLLATGRPCPGTLAQTVEEARGGTVTETATLVAAHGRLAKLVAPATPATLLLMDRLSHAQQGRWSTFGAVKLVRQMMAVALASVAIFIALSLSRYVGMDGTASVHSSGLSLLLNELFWIASAAIGASFAMLFQVDRYIADRTYDPAYAPSYWIKFMLGMIAGFILVALLPLPETDPTAAPGSVVETTQTFTEPLIAMLGGFSASAVYGILMRLVAAVEGLFAGSATERAAVREAEAVQRASGAAAEGRIAVAGKLVQVQQQLAAGGSPDEVARRLQEVVDALVGAEPEGGAPAAAEPAATAKVPALAVVGDGSAGDDGEASGDGEARG